jgi:hypothetical protein
LKQLISQSAALLDDYLHESLQSTNAVATPPVARPPQHHVFKSNVADAST